MAIRYPCTVTSPFKKPGLWIRIRIQIKKKTEKMHWKMLIIVILFKFKKKSIRNGSRNPIFGVNGVNYSKLIIRYFIFYEKYRKIATIDI